MFHPLRRSLFALLLAVLAFTTARADLVWSEETGWKVQGGLLSGLFGKEATTALSLMNSARAAEERGSTRRAIKLYERVGKKYPSSTYASEAFYRAARLHFQNEKWVKSFQDYQAVISRYPNTTRFDTIVGEQYEISAKLLNGARGKILWVLPGFTHRDRGMEFGETVVFNAPYSDYSAVSLMSIARQHERSNSPEAAIDALDRMINSYPKHVLTPVAYLRVGELYSTLVEGPWYDQAAAREAITYFEDFMILYPNDANVGAAEKNLIETKKELAMSKVKIADFYFKKRDNYKAAKVFYNEAITVFPESDVAEQARKRLVEVTAAETKAEEKAKREAAKNQGRKKKKRFWLF